MKHRPELTAHIMRVAFQGHITAEHLYWELFKLGWTDVEMAAGLICLWDGGMEEVRAEIQRLMGGEG